jgi:serine/threonine protein kinase
MFLQQYIDRQILVDLDLRKPLAHGYYSTVYRAKYKGIDACVKAHAKAKLDKTLLEFDVMSSLPPHEHVLKFLGFAMDGTVPLFITEWVEYGALSNIIKWDNVEAQKTLFTSLSTVSELMKFAQKIFDAVIHIHKHGIIHCDIAMRNILIDKNLQPKLADFGLSIPQHLLSSWPTSAQMKEDAPECLREDNPERSIKSDYWNCGILLIDLHEMFIRSRHYAPYAEDAHENDISTGKIGPRIPDPDTMDPTVLEAIKQCLQFDPNKRNLPLLWKREQNQDLNLSVKANEINTVCCNVQ